MPCARSATCVDFIDPPGNSAKTVASLAAFGNLPKATPPNLRKSVGLSSAVWPTPITTRRATFRPAGIGRSSVEFCLPVNRSTFAARSTTSAASPKAFRVAGPNFNPSSQNTIRTPFAGVANGAKPSFKASVIEILFRLILKNHDPLWPGLGATAKAPTGRNPGNFSNSHMHRSRNGSFGVVFCQGRFPQGLQAYRPKGHTFTFCCACSTGLPLPGHFVERSKGGLAGVEFYAEIDRAR